MVRICCIDNKVFGEKPPYKDKALTHGICFYHLYTGSDMGSKKDLLNKERKLHRSTGFKWINNIDSIEIKRGI